MTAPFISPRSTMHAVSGILFANDARKVAQFYVAVLGAELRLEDEHHAALDVEGFRLVIHRVSSRHAKDIRNPPLRRETGAIRLDYRVADVADARKVAKTHGGQIDDHPPAWAGQSAFFLGVDPEGNVFGVTAAHS